MISVSYLKSNCSREDTLKKINESNADLIHVDLMDGTYTEISNFTIDSIYKELKDSIKPLDIHLMVSDPLKYIDDLAKLKPFMITIHIDISNLEESIKRIKDYNIKVGLSLKPDQSIKLLDNYLDFIDYVLIMSVYPGAGGQAFIPEVLDKIDILEDKKVLIGIDGGINIDTIKNLSNRRVDIIISGSYICMSDNYNERINELKMSI